MKITTDKSIHSRFLCNQTIELNNQDYFYQSSIERHKCLESKIGKVIARCFPSMKKNLLMILTSTLLTLGITITSYAGWWVQDDTGWRYTNGVDYMSHGYNRIDGKLYYFNDDGYCLINAATPDGKYVVDENGVVTKDGIPDVLTYDQNPTYTLGINDVIWDLMNHTRAENSIKYGQDGARGYAGSYQGIPFTASYIGDTLLKEQQEAGGWEQEIPYVISFFSNEEQLSYAFKDAPGEDEIPLVEDIIHGLKNGYKRDNNVVVAKLRDLGYDAKFIKNKGFYGDRVQFKVDRFLITISYGNFYSEIQIRQDMQDFVEKEYQNIINAPLVTGF